MEELKPEGTMKQIRECLPPLGDKAGGGGGGVIPTAQKPGLASGSWNPSRGSPGENWDPGRRAIPQELEPQKEGSHCQSGSQGKEPGRETSGFSSTTDKPSTCAYRWPKLPRSHLGRETERCRFYNTAKDGQGRKQKKIASATQKCISKAEKSEILSVLQTYSLQRISSSISLERRGIGIR